MSIPELLTIARTKLANGSGDEALRIVMEVIRATKGDSAVMSTLDSMKQRLHEKETNRANINQRASNQANNTTNTNRDIDNICNRMEEEFYIDDECIAEAERLCCHLEQQDTLLLGMGREDILR